MMAISSSWIRSISQFISREDADVSAVSLKNRLQWQYRHRLNVLGWPGVVAIALLVAAPVFYFSTIRTMQQRLETAQRGVSLAEERILNNSKAARSGPISPQEQLVEFYKFFPSEKKSPLWLEKMVTVAEESGLELEEGEYKVTQDKVGQLLRYKITLPVQGKYRQVRKFLASLPAEIPPMALETVQFERKDITDTSVQVKIRLVLYMVQES